MKYKIISLILASMMLIPMNACKKTEVDTPNNGTDISDTDTNSGANDAISMPEGEVKAEEIITNDNYADSELYNFTGTIDEIYDDGSILVYSPDFRVNFNYMVIVEFDENTVVDSFELRENQHVEFSVYSSVKKSEPLTVVASKLTLLNEVSTQREEEAERIARLEEKVTALANPQATPSNDNYTEEQLQAEAVKTIE